MSDEHDMTSVRVGSHQWSLQRVRARAVWEVMDQQLRAWSFPFLKPLCWRGKPHRCVSPTAMAIAHVGVICAAGLSFGVRPLGWFCVPAPFIRWFKLTKCHKSVTIVSGLVFSEAQDRNSSTVGKFFTIFSSDSMNLIKIIVKFI